MPRTAESLLAKLNEWQHAAVANQKGPMLVLAGAGTGKTRVVTYRIAYLIQLGIQPDRILAVTFTNKAAEEMKQRVLALLGRSPQGTPEISTFHSFCARTLRRHASSLGLRPNFSIYSGSQLESLARRVLTEVTMAGIKLKPSDLLAWIGRQKTRGITPAECLEQVDNDKDHLAALCYRRMEQAMRLLGAVDFDDLLLFTARLFAQRADARRAEASRLDHILVDEYQDTNELQYRIVKVLAAKHRNLCVVGDDDQSIYGWRGAEVSHILGFKRDWPEALVVRLEQNYRSTAQILNLANRLIRCNTTRHDKSLIAVRGAGPPPRVMACQDENHEAEFVVGDIRRKLEHDHYQPKDVAVLFRTNEQPRALESQLRRWRIPYIVLGSLSFFDRREVRDVLAYMKVLDDPRDDPSLLRIINFPPRGISDRTIGAISKIAFDQHKTCWDLITATSAIPGVGTNASIALRSFAELVQRSRQQLATRQAADVLNAFLNDVDFAAGLRAIYQDPLDQQARMASVTELVGSVAAFESRAKSRSRREGVLGRFLNELALRGNDADTKENKLQKNAVGLLTLHAAKGLEFPVTYLVGMEEGLLPHYRSLDMGDAAVDEERRLAYVGVTRAQELLTISFARQRTKRGKPRPSIPSRFLAEMIGKAVGGPTSGPVPGPPSKGRRRASKPASRPGRAPG